MDEREEEPIEEAAGLLAGESARQIDASCLEEGDRPCQGIRLEGDVGVEEHEEIVARRLGELPAGVLFAAPAGGERLTAEQPDARIGDGKGRDDRRGLIPAVVVEDHQFEVDIAVGKNGGGEPADHPGFVAGRHEDGDPGGARARRRSRGAGEEPQIGERQQRRQAGQRQARKGPPGQDHRRCSGERGGRLPWEGSNG